MTAMRESGDPADRLEPALARVLQIGTFVSMGLVAIGTLLLIGGGHSPLDPGPMLNIATLHGDLLAGKPDAILWLGVLGVLCTPALRVVGAMVGFARAGERRMVAIAIAILVVVGLGIAAGLVTG